MHQLPDIRIPSICSIHIQDVGTIIKKFIGFQNFSLYSVYRLSFSYHIMLRNKYHICFRKKIDIFLWCKCIGIQHTAVVSCTLSSCSLIRSLHLYIVFLILRIRSLYIQPNGTPLQILDDIFRFRMKNLKVLFIHYNTQNKLRTFIMIFKAFLQKIVIKQAKFSYSLHILLVFLLLCQHSYHLQISSVFFLYF